MRRLVLAAMAVVLTAVTITAQIGSASGLVCTIGASGELACNGPVSGDLESKAHRAEPLLDVTRFIIEPGAALDDHGAKPISDVVLIGISEGELVNEKMPGRGVSLYRDAVFLLPKEEPYRLRNKGTKNVEVLLVTVVR